MGTPQRAVSRSLRRSAGKSPGSPANRCPGRPVSRCLNRAADKYPSKSASRCQSKSADRNPRELVPRFPSITALRCPRNNVRISLYPRKAAAVFPRRSAARFHRRCVIRFLRKPVARSLANLARTFLSSSVSRELARLQEPSARIPITDDYWDLYLLQLQLHNVSSFIYVLINKVVSLQK